MKPRALGLVLAGAIGLIALSLPSGAAAGGAGGSTNPAAPLIHQFPLGTQTLSRTTTASGGSATTSHRASKTTPHAAPTATPHRHGTAHAAPKHGAPGVSSVLFLLALPGLIVVALLSRMAIRSSDRTVWPRAGVRRRPDRIMPTAAPATRGEFEDEHELDREPPPRPVRPPTK